MPAHARYERETSTSRLAEVQLRAITRKAARRGRTIVRRLFLIMRKLARVARVSARHVLAAKVAGFHKSGFRAHTARPRAVCVSARSQ